MESQSLNVNYRKKKNKIFIDSFSSFPFDINLFATKSQKPIEAYLNSTHIVVYNIYDIEFLNNNGCFGCASLSRKHPSYHKIPLYPKHHPLFQSKHRCMSKRRFDRLTYLKNNGHTCMSKELLVEMSIKDDEFMNVDYSKEIFNRNNCTEESNNTLKTYDSTTLPCSNILKHENDCEDDDMVFVYDNYLNENPAVCQNLFSCFTLKANPFPLVEHLQLSFEEAFFLEYSFGCLEVYNSEKLLNITELWQKFISIRINFLSRYVAYHYYRSRGWVVKDGFKYGSDFVLYKKGPNFYHSSFSVIVCPQKKDQVESGDSDDSNEEVSPSTSEEKSSSEKMIIDVINNVSDEICNVNDGVVNAQNNYTEEKCEILEDKEQEDNKISRKLFLKKHFNRSYHDLDLCSSGKKPKFDQFVETNSNAYNSDITDNLTVTEYFNQINFTNSVSIAYDKMTFEKRTILLNDNLDGKNISDSNEKTHDRNCLHSSDYILSQLPNTYPSDWISMSCLTRITEQVAKDLVFCFVLFPEDMDVSSPHCLPNFSIHELIVKRWIPKKERDQK